MAKKDKKGSTDDSIEVEEGNKLVSIIVILLIILIWLGIFAALIKFDVMGLGTTMTPVLKDVPVVNKLLPETEEEQTEDIPYKSIAECAAYIKELETEIAGYQQAANEKDTKIADLEAEIARLKKFEENQSEFEKLRAQFYEEVVFGDNAPDISEYINYYRSIDPENAELLYQRAVAAYVYDEQVKARAQYYSSMKPDKAAAIFCEMTGDLDIVAALLNSMSAEKCGDILGAISDIDPVYAAKITKKLMP